MFSDLFVKDGIHFKVDDNNKLIPVNDQSFNILKQRISDMYNVDIDSLLTYDDMLKISPAKDVFWNVITMPKGDGDITGQRRDVKKSFLLIH